MQNTPGEGESRVPWLERMESMKSFRKELWFNTPTRRAYVNMTPQVEEALVASGIREGLVLVNAMHITRCIDYLLLLHK